MDAVFKQQKDTKLVQWFGGCHTRTSSR